METRPEIATSPDVVFGVPLYNHAHRLRESIESLLSQKYPSFAIVLVDDQSSDNTGRIAMEYADRFSNVVYHRNEKRLGLARNWRQAYLLAKEKYPGLKYFAWGSDHDVWHPRWLPAMIRTLEDNSRAVLAYPLNVRLTDEGNEFGVRPRRFDTRGVAGPVNRLLRSVWLMRAGDMVYGLFRADALEQGGVFRWVLLPDRMLLAELSLAGEFVQLPQLLWYRRYRIKVSLDRQRKSIFPDRAPVYSFLPWWLLHGLTMLWHWGIVGVGRPVGVGRLRGLLCSAVLVCSYALKEAVFRPVYRVWRRRLRRSPLVLSARRRFRLATRRSRLDPSNG